MIAVAQVEQVQQVEPARYTDFMASNETTTSKTVHVRMRESSRELLMKSASLEGVKMVDLIEVLARERYSKALAEENARQADRDQSRE
jgi:uncharacterized protein (DUF1778 family)